MPVRLVELLHKVDSDPATAPLLSGDVTGVTVHRGWISYELSRAGSGAAHIGGKRFETETYVVEVDASEATVVVNGRRNTWHRLGIDHVSNHGAPAEVTVLRVDTQDDGGDGHRGTRTILYDAKAGS